MKVSLDLPDIDRLNKRVGELESEIAQLKAKLTDREITDQWLTRQEFMTTFKLGRDKFYSLVRDKKILTIKTGPKTMIYKANFGVTK